MAQPKSSAVKRRLSIGGSSASIGSGMHMEDEPSTSDIQLQLRAVEKMARVAVQESQRTAKHVTQNEFTMTPWQNEAELDAPKYWNDFEYLLEQPEVKDMIADLCRTYTLCLAIVRKARGPGSSVLPASDTPRSCTPIGRGDGRRR